MAASGGHWKSGVFIAARETYGGHGLKYDAMSPEKVVRLARVGRVSKIAPLTKAQRSALDKAYRRGELVQYKNQFTGKYDSYGAPPPWAK